jgi:uncharacterized protein (DUF1810 family)
MSLDRFKKAQALAHGGYRDALTELTTGRKSTHWIWYIFPQLARLGHSSAAREYAIQNRAEAVAYLADPLLRSRLFEVTAVAANHLADGVPLVELMGSAIDAVKLVSSLTLFAALAGDCKSQDDEARAFVRDCEAILSCAERHGFARCAYTLQQIAV